MQSIIGVTGSSGIFAGFFLRVRSSGSSLLLSGSVKIECDDWWTDGVFLADLDRSSGRDDVNGLHVGTFRRGVLTGVGSVMLGTTAGRMSVSAKSCGVSIDSLKLVELTGDVVRYFLKSWSDGILAIGGGDSTSSCCSKFRIGDGVLGSI